MRRTLPALAALAVALLAAGCGSSGGSPSSAPGHPAGSPTGRLTVFAAASLQEAFTTLGHSFEAAHSGVRVRFSFGPSSGLAEQITQGAPADVFASASPTNMTQVVSAGDAAKPTDFARNVMEIAVPPKNPAGIRTVADLAPKSVQVALCQPQVPCGAVARAVLTNAGVTVTPVTLETDVKATLTKVELGEVDAGMVYVTDVRAAGAKVTGVPIPAKINASTDYPIAGLKKSSNAATAAAFVKYVLSPAGARVLTADGFEQP